MNAQTRYRSPTAFRAALEQRLRHEAQESGIALNRLRKEAAFNRLLARLHHTAPQMWALKGGLALIARVGAQVRATKDADANWRSSREELEDTLDTIEDLDMNDWFSFQVGDGHTLQGEGEEGALRYPVLAELDGRTFEQLTFDINVSGPTDDRPVELVTIRRNPFAFINEPPLQIPMVTPAQQLAEKLHAYTRRYEGEHSSRAKDLFDMLVIPHQVHLPDGTRFTMEARHTFAIRHTEWPPQLNEPPREWTQPWTGFITEYPVPWDDLDSAYTALKRFWEPVLDGAAAATNATWHVEAWQWK
jgi:predicted nucleotidyltransferase component of viral defense system